MDDMEYDYREPNEAYQNPDKSKMTKTLILWHTPLLTVGQ